MYQGHQVCHWLTDHTRPLFGEREMYVTVQSSLLIILRLPGVCWLEDPRGPPGGAAEQRAPCPGVQRDGTNSTSLTQAGDLRWSFEQDHLHQGLHKQIPQSPLRQSRGEGSSGGLDKGTRWAVSPVVLCLMDTLLIIKHAMPNVTLISPY